MSSTEIRRDLPNDEYQAAVGANNASASNVFATINDLTGAGGIEHGVAAGTNTYTVAIPGVVSYTDGDSYVVRFTNGSDADSTININGLGAITLTKQPGIQVTGGDIIAGQEMILIYDGTNFQCIGVAPNQLFAYVTNDEAITITKGQPVYAFGATGNRMSVKLAFNTSDATSAQTVGVVYSSSIAANQRGFIIVQGVVGGLDTSMYAPGDQLYLGATAGSLTNVKPYAPNHLVYIGIVERANLGNGQIYVRTQNGYELDELHDVDLITNPPTDGQVLTYDSVTGLWRNESLPADVNIYNSDGTVAGTRTVDLDGNTINFNDGKLGVNVTPGFPLQVRGTAVPSAGETVAKFDVSDSSAYLSVVNGTSTNGAFAPLIQGRQIGTSTQAALATEAIIDVADDTGTQPVTIFQTRLNTLAQIVTRPVFRFRNWSLDIMTMLANGNVGIGTTTPTEKLEVSGKTKTTTFQMTTTPTAGYVLTSDASGNGSWSAAAGGLTNFTEAQSTAAPNATVPVDSLTAVSATTNADVAIVPKGTGAFILAIPNNGSGGNKRGEYAVDLMLSRNAGAPGRVASGNYAFAAGQDSVASGTNSVTIGKFCNATNTGSINIGSGTASGSQAVAIGYSAVATNTNSLVFGQTSTASGNQSLSLGHNSSATGDFSYALGREHTVSGVVASAIGGQACTSSGSRSIVIGHSSIANGDYSFVQGFQSHSFGIHGRQTYASGQEGTAGDSQASKFILRERTTGNTATTITTNSGGASTTNQVILSNQSAYRFKGSIVGKQSGSVNAAVWDIDGFLVRGANAAATTLNVSNVTLVQNTPAWGTPTLAADTTNGGLQVQVTGATATNIQWTAVIETTEVIYA